MTPNKNARKYILLWQELSYGIFTIMGMGKDTTLIKMACASILFRIQGLMAYRFIARKMIGSGTSIRDIEPKDAAELEKIYSAYPGEMINIVKESVNGVSGAWLVAEYGSEIIGVVTAAASGDDNNIWTIYGLFTKPLFRRIGVAEKLVRETIRRARSSGAHAIGLFVNKGSFVPIRLYRKLGFTERPDISPNTSADKDSPACHIYLRLDLT